VFKPGNVGSPPTTECVIPSDLLEALAKLETELADPARSLVRSPISLTLKPEEAALTPRLRAVDRTEGDAALIPRLLIEASRELGLNERATLGSADMPGFCDGPEFVRPNELVRDD
jgi:hypothetical protein